MQIRMLRLLKESILFFNKFQLILLCLLVPKMKKVVKNMSSAIVTVFKHIICSNSK